jgi:hypothetical protein
LDYDCKKRKGAPLEEIRMSEDKFAESLQLAQLGMHNLMDGSGVEHITQVLKPRKLLNLFDFLLGRIE